MRTDLPDLLGFAVIGDLHRAADDATTRPAAAMDTAWPAIERAMFRLTGLAVSHWAASGRPDADDLPLPQRGGTPVTSLAMGSAVELIAFSSQRAELLTTSKPLPAINRLTTTISAVADATTGMDPKRISSPRFDLTAVVAGCGSGGRKGVSLTTGLTSLAQLRNLEAHHAGRAQEWVSGHPDYARLFAPLLVDAAWDLFGNAELFAPLRGWCVARVTDISPGRAGRPTLVSFEPDAPTVQRAYAEGSSAGFEVDDQAVIDIGADPIRARIVMPFIDVSGGVPPSLLPAS